MDIQALILRLTAYLARNLWIAEVFIVVFLVLLANLVARRLLNRLYRKLQRTENPWDDALIDALRKPVALLIWITGITFAARIVGQETGAAIFEAIVPLRDLGVVVTMTWFLVRLVKRVETSIITHRQQLGKRVDRTAVEAVSKLARAAAIITGTLVALQTLGYSISGVLAFGGIGGVAIGFASKDLLANFFGGLILYLDRPFITGDWIRSPDRDIEGTVEHIGWRLTLIRTFDKRPLYVPNSTFANIAVENPSRMTHRRIYETVGIRYDDAGKIAAIVREVKEMLINHPAIDEAQTLMVNFTTFAPSSLDFFIYAFTHTTAWAEFHEIKQDVLLQINRIIADHGAEIAFPTSTLHVPEGVTLLGASTDDNARSVP
ncbi:MAG TPA: mechanosensitive ion channel protein MscS [Betaproteobacteria bacterium]|nr:mechanosensitive ion channel protein MscS [Betaproteobacteria bacterium]